MHKPLFSLPPSLLALLLLASCHGGVAVDEGPQLAQSIAAENFTKIEASAGLNIIYLQADSTTITARGTEMALSRLQVEVKHGKLIATMKDHKNRGHKTVVIHEGSPAVELLVSAPTLEEVEVSAGVSFTTETLRTQDFDLSVSAGSKIDISYLSCAELSLEVFEGGEGHIDELNAVEAEVDVTSGGDFTIKQLACDKVEADVSTGSELSLNKVTTLTASLEATAGGELDAYFARCNRAKAEAASGGHVKVRGTVGQLERIADMSGRISVGK